MDEAPGDLRGSRGNARAPQAQHLCEVTAPESGRILTIDNRRLARAAKLAGTPSAKVAGIAMHVRLGDSVARGEPLFELHAEAPGELEYARGFLDAHTEIVSVGYS